MDNPGDYPLFAGPITTALDRATGGQTALDIDLSGLTALSLLFNFKWGSGGVTCSGIVQIQPICDTSQWFDIARADFTTAAKITRFNLEGLLSLGATAYADLAAEGVNDGLLFSRMRALLIVGATPYVDTTLSIIAGAR